MLDPRAHDVIAPFGLGGDLPVHRLAFGAMRITGPGIWGEPAITTRPYATLERSRSSSASTSSTPPTRTDRSSAST